MAVGLPAKTTYVDGDVFSASDINDTNGTINLIGQTNNFYAGKNKIINGAFDVWQRGTSITPTATTAGVYIADRFKWRYNGTGVTNTATRQTFTPGTAPVAGYEGAFFMRCATTVGGSGSTTNYIAQPIEDVRTFAGQTLTVSFWAKVDSGTRSCSSNFIQNFGSGGSADVVATAQSFTATTAWTRFSFTFSIAGITGKTVGTSSVLEFRINYPALTVMEFDLWGVQVEAGSTATAFQTATGTIQGELAACQRYYVRWGGDNVYQYLGTGIGAGANFMDTVIPLPVMMRVTPTAVDYSTLAIYDTATVIGSVTATLLAGSAKQTAFVRATVASGVNQYRPYFLITNNSTSGFIGISAEL
jgi:hypothetical protein